MDLIWLIPLLPGIGAVINGLVGIRYFTKRIAGVVAATMMFGAFALSGNAFLQLVGTTDRYHKVTVASWIPAIPLETVDGIGLLEVPWAFVLDPLSSMMLLIVTGVGLLIHIYSIGYIDHEPRAGVARFFCYLNLFCFFMLMLVLGGNFLVMFVGWEGVGLCSYLLIGYWYRKQSASDAGKKAFIINRVGDWGFVMGVFLIYFTFGTLDFREVAEAASAMPVETAAVGFGVLSLICLLLFIGATGKSAQIPLYVWLPDAMEGPTPVSALIHAATMVTAGVYMVCRNAVLFTHAPMIMEVVAVVGVLTALMAATIGLVQTDIKRVLAYSTVSQLGYMFLATGVGAFAAAAFHLMTHAFFKALLFLGSGSVIHGMNEEQDMRKMGGLKLLFIVPILLAAAWAWGRRKRSLLRPIFLACLLASFWKVGVVMFEHFPEEYFKYIAIGAAILIVLAFLVRLLRSASSPDPEIRLKRRREAYQKGHCPVCAYPWSSPEEGGPKGESSCPSCGTRLFESCRDCGGRKHSLLPHCVHCGTTAAASA